MNDLSNVIFIEWLNKKNFPQGIWLKEPDLCYWEYNKLSCLIIRDMTLGVWKGFVGVDQDHLFYNKPLNDILDIHEAMEIFFLVHGGICSAGHLIQKYKSYNRNLWWFGIETSHGSDVIPLLELENSKILSGEDQTYKDFRFIRRETNKLAKSLSKIK